MVQASVLGAAAGAGFALVIGITIVMYRYYAITRKSKELALASELYNKQKRKGHLPPPLALPASLSSVYISSSSSASIQAVQPRRNSEAPLSSSSTASAAPPSGGGGGLNGGGGHHYHHHPSSSSSSAVREGRGGSSPSFHFPAMPSSPFPRRASVCSTDLSPRQIPRIVSVDEGRSLLAVTRRGSDSGRGTSPMICTTSPDGSSSSTSPHFLGASVGGHPLYRSSSVDARCSLLLNSSCSSSTCSSSSDPPRSPIFTSSRPGSPRPHPPLSPLLIPKSPPGATVGGAQGGGGDVNFSPGGGAISPLGAIQPDLYKKKNDILVIESSGGGKSSGSQRFGRLHFRLKYDLDRSDLVVHVIEAHDLVQSEFGGFNDPYVKVSLEPEVDGRKRQTNIRRNSANPFFNETFKFPVALDELHERHLLLQVFDYDKFSRNDVIGEVRLPMMDVDLTSEVEVWSEIRKNKKPPGLNQELLLSLSYLPSAERLTVVVLKARNIRLPDSDDPPDPYVKIYLVNGNKRVKKKKTATQRGCSNPVWNEAITFNVPSDALLNMELELCVLNHKDLLSGGTTVAPLGTTFIGPRAQGTGQEHWNDMMLSMRKSVAMWHSLK